MGNHRATTIAAGAALGAVVVGAMVLWARASGGADTNEAPAPMTEERIESATPGEATSGRPLVRLASPGDRPPSVALVGGGSEGERAGVLFRPVWAGFQAPQPTGRPRWPAPQRIPRSDLRLRIRSSVLPRAVTVQAFDSINPKSVPQHEPVWVLDCWVDDFETRTECAAKGVGGAVEMALPADAVIGRYVTVYIAWPDGRKRYYGNGVETAAASWLFRPSNTGDGEES